MEGLQRLLQRGGMQQAGPPGDSPQCDTAETVYISSLALLKMLKHGARPRRARGRACLQTAQRGLLSGRGRGGRRPNTSERDKRPPGRAGVPMEVMGLMLGEIVDDYTVKVVDVFAMPQARPQQSPPRLSAPLPPPLRPGRAERHGGECGGGRPGVPDEDAGHAEADGASGGGGGLVPLVRPQLRLPAPSLTRRRGQAPGLWLLALRHGREHAAVL